MYSAVSLLLFAAASYPPPEFHTPTPLPGGDILVVGFMHGWERDFNPVRAVSKVAVNLRNRALPKVHVETAANRNRKLVRELILKSLDSDGSGAVNPEEAGRARIVIYGFSKGGSATVQLARELQALGIPVLLTVQVDSWGRKDSVIPSNVQRAVNFFQSSWPVRGVQRIRAENPRKTEILGNHKLSYRNSSIELPPDRYDHWQRHWYRPHATIDADAALWTRIENLILDTVRPLCCLAKAE
ncbi:MAG: hypothetical protein K2X35_04215 [Bryobacteraceae bacterium]|nr:hypothetical protein [Bryobacteraceae bacterium]